MELKTEQIWKWSWFRFCKYSDTRVEHGHMGHFSDISSCITQRDGPSTTQVAEKLRRRPAPKCWKLDCHVEDGAYSAEKQRSAWTKEAVGVGRGRARQGYGVRCAGRWRKQAIVCRSDHYHRLARYDGSCQHCTVFVLRLSSVVSNAWDVFTSCRLYNSVISRPASEPFRFLSFVFCGSSILLLGCPWLARFLAGANVVLWVNLPKMHIRIFYYTVCYAVLIKFSACVNYICLPQQYFNKFWVYLVVLSCCVLQNFTALTSCWFI